MSRVSHDVAGRAPDNLILVSNHVCEREKGKCPGLVAVVGSVKCPVTVHLPPGRTGGPRRCLEQVATQGVRCVEGPYEPIPGWRILRVDVADSSYAGATAIRLARRLDVNVIVPGMQRTVMIGETWGAVDQRRTLWGLEIGCANGVGKRAGFVVIARDAAARPRIVHLETTTRKRDSGGRKAA